VAQPTAVMLRACGLSAEMFDKVKRPELDGHIRLPRCAVRGRMPVRLSIFAGLAQSTGGPARGKPDVRWTEPASRPLAQLEEQPSCKR
jgi:hypothetical protein